MLVGLINSDLPPVVAVQTIDGANPNEALRVGRNKVISAFRQAVFNGQMVKIQPILLSLQASNTYEKVQKKQADVFHNLWVTSWRTNSSRFYFFAIGSTAPIDACN